MVLEEKYAEALSEMTKNRSSDDVSLIFSNFISVLKKNGHYKILPKILKSLEKLRMKEKENDIELVLAAADQEAKFRSKINEFQKYLEKDAKVVTKVDGTIVGGFIIRSKSVMIDMSYKKALMNLYNKFVS